jgi:hypothetical protein
MKTINLLPKEVKVKDVKGIVFNIVIVLFIVAAVILGALSVFLINANSNLAPKLDNYSRVNREISSYINKLETYEEFKNKVGVKSELVNSLKEYEISWSEILYDLGLRIPDNVFINFIDGNSSALYNFIEMKEDEQEEVNKVLFFTIGGYAVDYSDITRLLIEIKDIPYTGDVILDNIAKDQITESNIDVIFFTISAYYDIEPYKKGAGEEVETQESDSGEDLLESEINMMEE